MFTAIRLVSLIPGSCYRSALYQWEKLENMATDET